MTELVFNSGDYATLLSEAERLGFTYDDAEGNPQIIVNGPMASGGAYFLNVVGVIYEPITGPIDPESPPEPVARPGFWGRLRANGDTADLPSFNSSIIQYAYSPEAEGWVDVADGTPAPDFVSTIGMIA